MLTLQQTAGNAAIARALRGSTQKPTLLRMMGDAEDEPASEETSEEAPVHAMPVVTKSVTRYTEGRLFGHRFTLTVQMNDPDELRWWERTDKPYLHHMEADTWTDMYTDDSDVFTQWEPSPGRKTMTFVDPPAMHLAPNAARDLEFWIHFEGYNRETETKSGVVVRAIQILRTDAESKISRHEFYWHSFQISDTESLKDPPGAYD